MRQPGNEDLWYQRLVDWPAWEIPRPGKEALWGFVIVMAASLGLHGFLLWLCSLFGRST